MAQARHAAAVILVRETRPGGIEVYLTKRPETMRFVGGAFVFPGGAVEPGDDSSGLAARIDGREAPEMGRILGMTGSDPQSGEGLAASLWVTAARELFEEAGILFARRRLGGPLLGDAEEDGRLLETCRARLAEPGAPLAAILEEAGLFLALDRLFAFDHKITPEGLPVRYDTRFFTALLPRGQTANPSEREVADDVWLSPGRALARWEGGALPMIPPTVMMLERLAALPSWQAVERACS